MSINYLIIRKNINKNILKYFKEQHPFHLVSNSPWPALTAARLFLFLTDFVKILHNQEINFFIFYFYLFIFFYAVVSWFLDIVIEATFEGYHTFKVQKGLRLGILLFILSEVIFFFAFFWAFFHSAISPTIAIRCTWPPVRIITLNPWGIPFLNTIILLSSRVSVTWAHRALIYAPIYRKSIIFFKTPAYLARRDVVLRIALTCCLGLIFTILQKYEYEHALFNITDRIYRSTFYVTTRFHRVHVLIRTVFLFIALVRHLQYHFTNDHHFRFEAAIYYWHFVDVVWLLLFVSIYWWGS
jgi:cytochrome c oxidase subunit 3